MELIDINKKTIKQLIDKDEIFLQCTLLPYQKNSKIKVYYEDTPIGDVPENYVSEMINKTTANFYIDKSFDDNTGLFELKIVYYETSLPNNSAAEKEKTVTEPEVTANPSKKTSQDLKFFGISAIIFIIFLIILWLI